MIILKMLFEIELSWTLFFLVLGFITIYNYLLIELLSYKFNTDARQRTFKEILRLLHKIAGEEDNPKIEN